MPASLRASEPASEPQPASEPVPAGPGRGLRRRPVQRRSQARVQRMLDAAAALLDQVGYADLTTREVAARAGVPIGTLYQFFDGKDSLLRALAERNLAEFLARLERRLAGTGARHWHQTAAVVVEEFVAMKRSVPGFLTVDFGDARPGMPYLLDAAGRVPNNDIVAARLAELGSGTLGLPTAPDLGRVLLVAVELADSLLRLAFRADPAGDPALIAEAEQALAGYLAGRLG